LLFILLHATSNPYDWKTDPTVLAWIAVASLIAGILGLGAAIFFYWRGKKRHRVFYEVISDTPLVSIRDQIGKGKINVTYERSDGNIEPINDARLLILKVWNAGNDDIVIWSTEDKDLAKANGLEIPIEFEFEGREVIGLTQLETNPKDIILHENFDKYANKPFPTPTSLGLPTCKLKPNQLIQLGVLLNGSTGKTNKIEGSLLNGEILDINQVKRRNNRIYIVVIALSLFLMGGLVSLTLFFTNEVLTFLSVIIIPLTVLSIWFIYDTVLRNRHSNDRSKL